MGWFGSSREPSEDDDLGPRVPGTVYAQVFERKRMPDEGAQSYAYESLDLPQYTYIGAGVHVREASPAPITVAPVYAWNGALVNGMALTAGQYYTTPLVDQNGMQVDTGLGNDTTDYQSLFGYVDGPNLVKYNLPTISPQPETQASVVNNVVNPYRSR